MKQTEAMLKAHKRYMETLDEIKVRVPKGDRDQYKLHAQLRGMSLNAYVIMLLNKDADALYKEGKLTLDNDS